MGNTGIIRTKNMNKVPVLHPGTWVYKKDMDKKYMYKRHKYLNDNLVLHGMRLHQTIALGDQKCAEIISF